ncbi:MAG: hypothetical protein ACRDT4_07030 [Micromonosporaceae bacterium]
MTVLPYGGDVAVAQSIADVHRRNPWTGRCRACRDRYPCRDRQDANAVLGAADHARPSLVGIVGAVVPILLGVLLIAASMIELMR